MRKALLSLTAFLSCASAFGSAFGDELQDVVVIGAGLSGLNAARTIHALAPDKRLLVLEARNRLGGRTWTHEGVEMGGELIDKDHVFMRGLLKDLGLPLDSVKLTGEVFSLLDHKKQSTKALQASLDGVLAKLKFLHKTLRKEEKIIFADGQPIYAGLIENLQLSDIESRLFGVIVQDETGRPLDEVPLVDLAGWIKRLEGYQSLFKAKASFFKRQFLKGYTYQYRVHGGTSALCDTLAALLPENSVRLETPATHITRANDVYRIQTPTGDILTRHLVITTPFSVLRGEGLLDMEALGLNADVKTAIATMPYGRNGKVIVPTQEKASVSYFIDGDNGLSGWSNPKGLTFITTHDDQTPLCEEAVTSMGYTRQEGTQVVAWSQDPYALGSWSIMVAKENCDHVSTRLARSKELAGLIHVAGPFNENSLFFAGEHTCDEQTPIKANNNKPIIKGYMQSALFSGHVVGSYLGSHLGK